MVWGTPNDTSSLSSYRVSWALWAEDGFTSYKDENSNTGGNAYPDAPASSYTITGVAPGEYAVYVRARYDDYQNGPFIKSSKVVVADAAAQEDDTATPTPEPTEAPTATPDPTPEPTSRPGDITGLTMTSSRPGQLFISWDESIPAPSEYRLNWAPVDDPFPAWNSNQGGNLWISFVGQDLSNVGDAGVTYKLRMRAIYKNDPDGDWAGDWSEVTTKRVRNQPPGAPTGLSVDSATHDGVVLSWSAPGHSALTGYRIQRGSDADSLETIVENTGDLEVSYTDTTAADDATYHYAIIALSLDGDSAQSGTVSATTPPRTPVTPVIKGAPGAPSTLTAELDGSGGVTLSWTDPDDSAITGYRILRGVDARSMRVIVENTGSATVGYTDATAAVNTAHVYAVQARNSVGLSQLSNTVSITTLSAPTELDVSASSGRVALSWSAPDLSAITGYRVMRGSTASSLNQVAVVSGRSNTFYTDFDVLPLSQYHYAVRALSAQGSSPLSETISATTQPVTTVSRFIRFDQDDRLVIQQDADPLTPVTLVSNEDGPNAVKYATDGTTAEFLAFSKTRTASKDSIHVSFRTGPQPGGYNLTSLSATLRRTSASQEEPKAQVRILADNNGLPGSVVHTLSEETLTTTRSRVTFTAPAGATLEPNTTYWAQFNENSSSSVLEGHPGRGVNYSIRQTRHSLEDRCAVPGWSIGNDNYVTFPDSAFPSFWSGSGSSNQGPSAPKIAITGYPLDGSVSEGRCNDLPQAITTTGELPIGGGAIGSLYPDSLDPTDRDWYKVTLEANVLYQFDAFHSRRVNGREGTTIGSARIHRILDSTGAAVTSDVSYKAHQDSGVTGDRTFFTPTTAGAYYLEVGVGSKKSLIDQLEQLVNWGTCTGHLPDPTRQVKTLSYTVQSVNTYYIDIWRHPGYDGWWEQVRGGSGGQNAMISCSRKFDHNDIRNGGTYYVTAKVADEYTADTSTTATIAPGGYLTGRFYQDNGSNRDEDWIKVNLTQGTTYRFTHQVYTPDRAAPTITGIYDSGGTLVQGPVSTKYNAAFKIVSLDYTPTVTGIYYVGLQNSDTSDRNRGAAWSLTLTN